MMIFRQFDLATEHELVDEIINNPLLMPIELNVSCTETGWTTILVRAHRSPEKRTIKRTRRFRRFVLYGGINEALNQLMEDENVRILKRHDFFSEQGAIIVLDYETNPEE